MDFKKTTTFTGTYKKKDVTELIKKDIESKGAKLDNIMFQGSTDKLGGVNSLNIKVTASKTEDAREG